jgi:TonB family protein
MAAARVPVRPPKERSVRWWMPVTLCLIGGIGGAALYELWTISRQPRWAELYLDAKPAADAKSLMITWDAAASQTAGATHALLGINDGAIRRDVPLTAAELKLGHYSYTPANPDLELRLVLYGNGPAVSGGTLRIAPAVRVNPKPAPEPAPAIAAPPAASPVAAPAASPAPESSGPRTVVHEVKPSVPDGIRARLSGNMEIPVTVKINPRGQVISAFTPQSVDGLRRFLGQEAVKAARQWRFTPAGALSEKTIYFTFNP